VAQSNRKGYEVRPFPKMRRFALDAGYLGRRRHIVHGLIEVDVTDPRSQLRDLEDRMGEKPSFTAFIVNCIGHAVETNKHVHAYRNWRNQLVIFDDVNVNLMIEIDMDGRKIPMPHILKAVNRRTFLDIHRDIRSTQGEPDRSSGSKYMRLFLLLPAFVRRIFNRIFMRVPEIFHEYSSSVLVTALGMFFDGPGWGITMPNFSLTIALGGISEKPGVVDGRIEIREYLNITLSFDHDIVDGAPAARFSNQLKDLIENGYGLAIEEKPSLMKE
jgi:pyruvate/2-oxoglutarate dehydrogenase complex dihydrolipoamide acyltransferase (E2) component